MSDEDYEFGQGRGLPKRLPPGEVVLWQGAPSVWRFAVEAFHIRKAIAFVVVLAILRVALNADASGAIGAASWAAFAQTLTIGAGLVVVLGLIALWSARSTVYSITSGRVVMSFGLLAPIALNLPFSEIEGAGLKTTSSGVGDIPLSLSEKTRLGYLHLWPHVRPWHTRQPQPMLRAIPEAERIGQLLADAIGAETAPKPVRV
ncbi:MAG: photosynthetic complex putative assembly protein PuhB, partial [Pseudomonadota bacterium]